MRSAEGGGALREIEAAAAKIDGGADAFANRRRGLLEIAGSSTDSSFTPDDADGPTPYDYMAIVLAVAWLGPTVYYTAGRRARLALDGCGRLGGRRRKLPSNHPPVPWFDLALRRGAARRQRRRLAHGGARQHRGGDGGRRLLDGAAAPIRSERRGAGRRRRRRRYRRPASCSSRGSASATSGGQEAWSSSCRARRPAGRRPSPRSRRELCFLIVT